MQCVNAISAEIRAHEGGVVTRLHASFVEQADWNLVEVSRNEEWTAGVSLFLMHGCTGSLVWPVNVRRPLRDHASLLFFA